MIGVEGKEKKQVKTYGKTSQDIFEFRGSSDDEGEGFGGREAGSIGGVRSNEGVEVGGEGKDGTRDDTGHERLSDHEDELCGCGNKDLDLSSGERQGVTAATVSLHSSMLPRTMPHVHQPEPSTISTVPFTSPAQSTPKETGTFEFHLSNDRMPTPTVSSKSRSDVEKPASSGQSSVKFKKGSNAEIEEEPSPSFEKLSQPENRDSPRPRKRGRTKEDFQVLPSTIGFRDLGEKTTQSERPRVDPSMVDTLMQSLPYTANRAAIEKTIEDCGGNINLAASRLLDVEEQNGGHDELSLPQIGSAETRSSKPDKKNQSQDKSHNDELGSDDIDIGLPKEQYQPRPSRSRSGQVEGEDLIIPVDFSKRPETLGKSKKSKRRKTTALAEAAPKYEEEEDEDLVPLFGDGKSRKISEAEWKTMADSAKAASIEAQGTHLDAQDDDDASPTARLLASKKQRGRPYKKATEPSEVIPEEQPLTDNLHEEPIVQILEDFPINETEEVPKPAAPKKQRGRPHNKAAEDPPPEPFLVDDDKEDPDEDAAKDFHENQPLDNSKPAAAKKQRGRPKKKAAEVPEDASSDLDPPQKSRKRKKSAVAEEPPIRDDDNEDDEEAQPKIQEAANTASAPNGTSKSAASPILAEIKANKPSPSPIKAADPSTPSKPKGPDKHSPLQSSKVRYRVGLSKRARIEPLLRVVRK